MPLPPPVLDHVVVNVRGDLDRAEEVYRRLGFQLTPRGHHTLGSSNHLAILGENYLELLGFEPGRGTGRADLWSHPLGLTGLVFKTGDAARTAEELAAAGVPHEPTASFSRPVALPEGERDVAFRVTRVRADLVENGRVFFCEHRTPDLVWRDAWRAHPNGALDITGFTIAAADPARTAGLYRSMFGADAVRTVEGGLALAAGVATVEILTPEALAARFGEAVPAAEDGGDRMAALALRSADLDRTAAALAGVAGLRREGPRILVPAAAAFGVALAFSA